MHIAIATTSPVRRISTIVFRTMQESATRAKEQTTGNRPDRMKTEADANRAAIVTAFRAARIGALPLLLFPGVFPVDLAEAYAIQDAAITAFPDRVQGWKIAGILPEFREALGASRLSGPAFAKNIQVSDGRTPIRFPVFSGGFAAVEAEFIFVMARDINPGDALDRPALLSAIASMHAGVETAGSPFAAINDRGPLAVISDLGNNNGLIVGAEIPGWREAPLETLTSRTLINGVVAGEGSAAKVMGGPIAALEFLVENLGGRGLSLRAGDYVSTGMTTGIHLVAAGDRADFEFAGGIRISSEAIAASPA